MTRSSQNQEFFRFDRYHFRPNERLLTRDGEIVHLTPRVFDLLDLLVRHFGQVVTKEDILNAVWAGKAVEEGNINRTVSTLRKQLGNQVNGNDFIETVPTVGYRFVAPVERPDIESEEVVRPAVIVEKEKGNGGGLALAVIALVVLSIFGYSVFKNLRASSDPERVSANVSSAKRLTNSPENEQVAGWTSDDRILITRWSDKNTPETYVVGQDGGSLVKASAAADVRQFVPTPDGKRMIFWRYSDGGATAYLAASDGTGSQKLPFSVENAAWSPDGSRFAFQTNSTATKKLQSVELLTYSIADQKVTELTSNSNFDGDPGWSPDGQSLVFSSDRDGNYEIYSMKFDGSDIRRLTNNAGHDSFPKYSPDGTQIAFNSNIERETTDVYVMNSDGQNPIRLTDSKGNELTRNGWSPDGTKLAYNSDVDGNDEIYVMDVEPFKPQLLIEDKDAELQTPSYSPDGRKVVYTAEFADKHSELRIYDRVTRRSTLLLNTSSPQNYPRWSPDGQWIAFHQEVNGKWDVFKIRPNGEQLTNLSNDPSSDSIPTWSGDSATIYFRSNRNGDSENSELFKMNADGTGQTVLPIKKGKVGWGSVSPNGTEIAFASDRNGDAEKLFDIFIGDLATGTERPVASRSKNDIQSTFSNDGSSLAFVAASDGNQEIYITRSDGSGMLRLTRNSANDLNPSFSFDGKSIVFASNRNGKAAIFEISY